MQTQDEIVAFTAADGHACNLVHVQGRRSPDKGPVLLVPGAGVRANIFRPPVEVSFVDYLLEHGYDVWLENWRASIDLPPCEWTLDQAALYDHPVAVKTVLEHTGAATMKAVIHCQGSTSFAMSAVAGLVPGVSTIVSNAVSLHPIVPWITQQKLSLTTPLMAKLTRYVDSRWGEQAPGLVPKLLQAFVRLTHHECNNGVCRMSSFIFGVGFPTLWRHQNLNAGTHDWIRDELAKVPLSFFKQMKSCVNAGHLVSYEGLPGLPDDYTAQAPKTTARFAFIAGERNACFHWQSQQASYDWFSTHRPNYNSLHVLSDYGHLDVFLGQQAVRDTYPVMLSELERPN